MRVITLLFVIMFLIGANNNVQHPSTLERLPNLFLNEQRYAPTHKPSANFQSTEGTTVTNFTGEGTINSATEYVHAYQYSNLTFNSINGHSDSFSIPAITNFTATQLEYNITQIQSIPDFYILEHRDGVDKYLSVNDNIALAQQFFVDWNYVVCKGINITLLVNRVGNLGAYNLELMIVKDNGTGYPDMNNVVSYAVESPINESNYDILGTPFRYFAFPDTILSKGQYFIVANLSIIDQTNPSQFIWEGKIKGESTRGLSYQMNGAGHWEVIPKFDFSLILHFLPSTADGNPYIFSNPEQISLQDNGKNILTLNDAIAGTGLHSLTTNTSVNIVMNNSYLFSRVLDASAIYTANNGTLGEYTVDWLISWNISSLDDVQYDDYNHYINIECPSDWNNEPIVVYNSSSVREVERDANGYWIQLNNTQLPGEFKLYTTSPNYLNDTDIISSTGDKFFLGYWVKQQNQIIGYEGSRVDINFTVSSDILTGNTNVSLYNPSGKILPRKPQLPTVLYNDSSDYSVVATPNILNNYFIANITFDPSYNGSERTGYWTVLVSWSNGSEVGIFTKNILVSARTAVEYKWKTLEDSNQWTNTTIIERFSGSNLTVDILYKDISVTDGLEIGAILNDSTIHCSTSWNYEQAIPFGGHGQVIIPLESPAGEQIISITCFKPKYEEQSLNITVRIYYQFSVQLLHASSEVNTSETSLANVTLQVINESSSERNLVPLASQDVALYINDILTTEDYYLINNNATATTISLNVTKLGILEGNFNLRLEVHKQGFKESLDNSTIVLTFGITVTKGIIPTNTTNTTNATNPTQQTTPSQTIPPNTANNNIAPWLGALIPMTLIGVGAVGYTYWKTHQAPEGIESYYDVYLSSKDILKILVVHTDTSLPVVDIDIKSEFILDSALVSGFFQAISMLGSEISGTDAGGIERVQYKNLVVSSHASDNFTCYVFSKQTLNVILEDSVKGFVLWFENEFKGYDEWDGNTDLFNQHIDKIKAACDDFFLLWMHKKLKLVEEEKIPRKYLATIEAIKNVRDEEGFFTIEALLESNGNGSKKEKMLENIIKLRQKRKIITEDREN